MVSAYYRYIKYLYTLGIFLRYTDVYNRCRDYVINYHECILNREFVNDFDYLGGCIGTYISCFRAKYYCAIFTFVAFTMYN